MMWEYCEHILDLYNHDLRRNESDLNGLGADGWELVSMHGTPTTIYAFFKRPIRSQHDPDTQAPQRPSH